MRNNASVLETLNQTPWLRAMVKRLAGLEELKPDDPRASEQYDSYIDFVNKSVCAINIYSFDYLDFKQTNQSCTRTTPYRIHAESRILVFWRKALERDFAREQDYCALTTGPSTENVSPQRIIQSIIQKELHKGEVFIDAVVRCDSIYSKDSGVQFFFGIYRSYWGGFPAWRLGNEALLLHCHENRFKINSLDIYPFNHFTD